MPKRWKLVILFHLFGGKIMRFSELERAIPAITQKMLGQQLKAMKWTDAGSPLGCAISTQNMRLAMTRSYRVFVCSNMASVATLPRCSPSTRNRFC